MQTGELSMVKKKLAVLRFSHIYLINIKYAICFPKTLESKIQLACIYQPVHSRKL